MRMLSQVAEGPHYTQAMRWRAAHHAALQRMQQLGIGQAAHQWLHQISGGMAQRVGVAASGLSGAQLLIADEPTKGLDPASRAQVAQLLLGLQSTNQALLTITHDLELARMLGGQLMVLQAGCVVESGAAEMVLEKPQHAYTEALLAAQPSRWPKLAHDVALDTPHVISATGLSKRYGGGAFSKQLFNDLHVEVKREEILSVSGTSGCGKTTLGNILLGLVGADRGSVHKAALPSWRFQKLYQDPPAAFAPSRRLREALNDLIALHRLDAGRVEPLMTKLNLSPDLLDRMPGEVSGGQLQRIALLRILLLEPVFVFADEPTSRLDVITQFETMKLLVSAAQSQGCAVLLVSHDADLALACSHRHIKL
jgi:ABC-type glutathione transport system ATPase component